MAIRVDASGDSYSRTTNAPSVTSYTAMGWFNITTDRNDFSQFIVNGHATNDAIIQLGTDSNGTTLQCYVSGSGGTNGSALTVGTWYHLAVTRSGTGAGACLAYLNGVLDITPGNAATPSTGKIWFMNSSFTEWINGRCAALKVWDAVLTVSEIAQEMRCYQPIRTVNLNAWYPLADPTVANNTTDYSGAGNNLTAGGTLTSEDGPPIAWRTTRMKLFIPPAVVADTPGPPYAPGQSVFLPYRQPPIAGPQFTQRYG